MGNQNIQRKLFGKVYTYDDDKLETIFIDVIDDMDTYTFAESYKACMEIVELNLEIREE